jgi:hypothetical protein
LHLTRFPTASRPFQQFASFHEQCEWHCMSRMPHSLARSMEYLHSQAPVYSTLVLQANDSVCTSHARNTVVRMAKSSIVIAPEEAGVLYGRWKKFYM